MQQTKPTTKQKIYSSQLLPLKKFLSADARTLVPERPFIANSKPISKNIVSGLLIYFNEKLKRCCKEYKQKYP